MKYIGIMFLNTHSATNSTSSRRIYPKIATFSTTANSPASCNKYHFPASDCQQEGRLRHQVRVARAESAQPEGQPEPRSAGAAAADAAQRPGGGVGGGAAVGGGHGDGRGNTGGRSWSTVIFPHPSKGTNGCRRAASIYL